MLRSIQPHESERGRQMRRHAHIGFASFVGVSMLAMAFALAPAKPALSGPTALNSKEVALLVGGCSVGDASCKCATISCGGTGTGGTNPCNVTNTTCSLVAGKCMMLVKNNIAFCGAPDSSNTWGCEETVDPGSYCAYVISADPSPSTGCASKPKSSWCQDAKETSTSKCGDETRTCSQDS